MGGGTGARRRWPHYAASEGRNASMEGVSSRKDRGSHAAQGKGGEHEATEGVTSRRDEGSHKQKG